MKHDYRELLTWRVLLHHRSPTASLPPSHYQTRCQRLAPQSALERQKTPNPHSALAPKLESCCC